MSTWVSDVAAALGEGIYSVGEDLVYGLQRTGQGLGTSGMGRMGDIGVENKALADLLADLVRWGYSEQSPLFKLILAILEQYYDKIPAHILKKIAEKAGLGAAYTAGRMIIGKMIAKAIAIKIARQIATMTGYQQFTKKLLFSSGSAASGIGIPISMIMFQGVAQRASLASVRLRSYPTVYNILRWQRQDRLDLLFFLVEKPLENHLNMINFAAHNLLEFERRLKKLEEELGD